MSNTFKQQLQAHARWKQHVLDALGQYQQWLEQHQYGDPAIQNSLLNMQQDLQSDKITLAFAAEFSRGKTELINAMFFGETGNRLLPSSPGRTTMCPTELYYDASQESYIRLLPIETRFRDTPLAEYKQHPEEWRQVELDYTSPRKMQEAFKELTAIKQVSVEEARELGLYHCVENQAEPDNIRVEIPRWRHALISYPHPMLKDGLVILDTPGLNALGAEPELTLSMLPNAQALIFVLAADTGVTKSDLELWQNHIQKNAQNEQKGLAVVLNKIDTLWDDLVDDHAISESIDLQLQHTADILDLDPKVIFPVSAKQALIAKVKDNLDLLEKSRVGPLELYLSDDLLDQRRQILVQKIMRETSYLVDESFLMLASQIDQKRKQLNELRALKVSNLETAGSLLSTARKEQRLYVSNIENFQISRRSFVQQAQSLANALHPSKVEVIVQETRRRMTESLTTVGMKSVMKDLFMELDGLLYDAIETTETTRQLVKGIYRTFAKAGLENMVPNLFSINKYQIELEHLFQEGEAFRSSTLVTFTGQNLVIRKLYGTIVAEAIKRLHKAYTDAQIWSKIALGPLERQIKSQREQLETRIKMLNEIKTSSATVDTNIRKLEEQLTQLIQQHEELVPIKQQLNAPNIKQQHRATAPDDAMPETSIDDPVRTNTGSVGKSDSVHPV